MLPALYKSARHKLSVKTRGAVTLYPAHPPKGWVLLSYITEPFVRWPNQPISSTHSNYWECHEIASLFLHKGYGVDVIDWRDHSFIPTRKYSVCIDIHNNLSRLAPYMTETIKVFHITGAHWLTTNTAELTRLLDVKKRRGVVLLPRRSVSPHSSIEAADYATVLGNAFTQDTYAYAHKPIFYIPISSPNTFDFPQEKDFAECRKHFLWFGGAGMVHKGLDLVLEAFANMPEYTLTVCGPVQKEKDFEQAYHRELYGTPNIRTLGRIPIEGEAFSDIVLRCGAIVFPSCAEGGGGSVVNCMQAGMVPIVTPQASVEIGDFGILLQDSSSSEIQRAVRTFAAEEPAKTRERAYKAWGYAHTTHAKTSFTAAYSKFIDTILPNA